MSTIAVELPEDLRDFVETRVRQGEFASASDYIVALVDAARSKRSELEVALLQGLESGPAEQWSPQEWADMKHRLSIGLSLTESSASLSGSEPHSGSSCEFRSAGRTMGWQKDGDDVA
jgi:antitoxin ParD1/3/4